MQIRALHLNMGKGKQIHIILEDTGEGTYMYTDSMIVKKSQLINKWH